MTDDPSPAGRISAIGEAKATGLGLKNLRQRAERLGGSIDLGRSREGGTRLTWHVPLGSVEAGTAPTR